MRSKLTQQSSICFQAQSTPFTPEKIKIEVGLTVKQRIKKENPTDPEVKVKEEPLDTFEDPEETEIDVTVDNLLDEAIDELSEKEFPIDNQTESDQAQESAESPDQPEANEPEGKDIS